MGHRRTAVEEVFVLDGDRDVWIESCEKALRRQGFTKVATSLTLYQVTGNYKKFTVWGDITLTLTPEGVGSTRIAARAVANTDNIYALFASPGRKILARFKMGIAASAAPSQPA